MNNENLIPIEHLSKEEAKRRGSLGGKASAASKRRRRDMKAKMRMLLDMPVNDCEDYNSLAAFGVDMEDIDNETLMLVGLFRKAKNGDVQAVKEIRNILGRDKTKAENDLIKAHAVVLKAKAEMLSGGNTDALERLDNILSEMRSNADTEPKAE